MTLQQSTNVVNFCCLNHFPYQIIIIFLNSIFVYAYEYSLFNVYKSKDIL